MEVHKESFTLCCYDFSQDKVFYTQKMESDYMQILKGLDAVRSGVGGDVQFVCGYEAGCLGFTLYHQLTQHRVKSIILVPTTMMKVISVRGCLPLDKGHYMPAVRMYPPKADGMFRNPKRICFATQPTPPVSVFFYEETQ